MVINKKNVATRFLISSFIGLLIFSIAVFSLLGIYMSRKSKKTVYEIGNIYMSGMNEQMSRHFETVIKLRFDQVSGVVSVVSTDNNDMVNFRRFTDNPYSHLTQNLLWKHYYRGNNESL